MTRKLYILYYEAQFKQLIKVVCYLPEFLPANHSGTALPLLGVRSLLAMQVVGVVNSPMGIPS